MNRTQAMIFLNRMAQEGFGSVPQEYRPSAFFLALGVADWDQFWAERVSAARQEVQAYVWRGEILPTGYPAPAEAVPGASYVIVSPSGTVIFQYGDSPYAPDTPGLAPATLTQENVQVAMEAHAMALAETLALERLSREYQDWLAEHLL